MTSNLSWWNHIIQFAKSASKKLGVLFHYEMLFTLVQLLKPYNGLVCPRLEYYSHVWGASSYASILGRVEQKAFCLISDPTLTSTLNSLTLHQKVALFPSSAGTVGSI